VTHVLDLNGGAFPVVSDDKGGRNVDYVVDNTVPSDSTELAVKRVVILNEPLSDLKYQLIVAKLCDAGYNRITIPLDAVDDVEEFVDVLTEIDVVGLPVIYRIEFRVGEENEENGGVVEEAVGCGVKYFVCEDESVEAWCNGVLDEMH
jgi:hypothetical protein